jgi:hypothetical protein
LPFFEEIANRLIHFLVIAHEIQPFFASAGLALAPSGTICVFAPSVPDCPRRCAKPTAIAPVTRCNTVKCRLFEFIA